MMKATTGVLLLALAGMAWAEPQQVVAASVQLEDADTLLVDAAGGSYRIQLPGVDAPESTMNPKLQRDIQRTGLDAETLLGLGRAADEGLRGLLDEFTPYVLEFDPDRRDKYGRVPGDLIDAEGRRLSVRLVESGYAIPMPTTPSAQPLPLDAALAGAMGERRGLWGSHADVFAAWARPANTPQGR